MEVWHYGNLNYVHLLIALKALVRRSEKKLQTLKPRLMAFILKMMPHCV